MSRQKKVQWLLLFLALALSGAFVFSLGRGRANLRNKGQIAPSPPQTSESQGVGTLGPKGSTRNLALQPEAFKLSRRVGQRFMSGSREVSVMNGTLLTGSERLPFQIIRRQTDRGEQVDIAINGAPPSLTWSDDEGPKASDRAANETERALIERLALDSVDQFVLAQLKGASYYTVARNVRPAEAGDSDNYNGPLWDLVRVDYHQQDTVPQPLTPSRLYYINSITGLIDKIACEIGGERIEANFSGWQEQAGETVPSRITWARDGQTLMEFQLTNFTHNSQQ